MEQAANLWSKLPIVSWRDHVLRLVVDKNLPELATWKGSAQLVGLWFILLVGFAVTPIYVLLRLPFQQGGWRFLVMLVSLLVVLAFVVIFMILAAGMAGLGSIR